MAYCMFDIYGKYEGDKKEPCFGLSKAYLPYLILRESFLSDKAQH